MKQTLKCKLDQAGVQIDTQSSVAERMAGYLLQSRADNTVKKYKSCFALFEKFCFQHILVSKPALPISVAMYFTSLLDEGKSVSVITSAYYGIKWAHTINDLVDPTENSIVKQLLECAKRNNSKPVQKKDILTSDMLKNLCFMYTDCTNVLDLRDLCMIMLAYTGFLRISEVTELRCKDVNFNDDHIVIKIRKSKTDIYRDGSEVVICKGVSEACPLSLLYRYMNAAGISSSSDDYLFKPGFC